MKRGQCGIGTLKVLTRSYQPNPNPTSVEAYTGIMQVVGSLEEKPEHSKEYHGGLGNRSLRGFVHLQDESKVGKRWVEGWRETFPRKIPKLSMN